MGTKIELYTTLTTSQIYSVEIENSEVIDYIKKNNITDIDIDEILKDMAYEKYTSGDCEYEGDGKYCEEEYEYCEIQEIDDKIEKLIKRKMKLQKLQLESEIILDEN